MGQRVFIKVLYLFFHFFVLGHTLHMKVNSQISNILMIGKGIIDITPKIYEKQLGCSGRKTRQNIILLQNMFQQNITLRERGVYLSDGMISNGQRDISLDQNDQPGRYEISSNHSTVWTFTSLKGAADYLSSSSGLIVWEIQDNQGYGLVIFFKNPIVFWNFMGVCIQKVDQLPKSGQSIIAQKLKYKENWGSNCVLLDNRQRQQLPYFRQESLSTLGYSVSILGKYIYEYNFKGNCYSQYLIIGVGKQLSK